MTGFPILVEEGERADIKFQRKSLNITFCSGQPTAAATVVSTTAPASTIALTAAPASIIA